MKLDPIEAKVAAQRTVYNTFAPQILTHYARARAEHPHFCDSLLPKCETKEDDDAIVSQIKSNIAFFRQRMEKGNELHNLMWNEILCLKVWEATNLIHNGDTAASVERLYEGVAVLLRAIDAIEGRQPLGNPISKPAASAATDTSISSAGKQR